MQVRFAFPPHHERCNQNLFPILCIASNAIQSLDQTLSSINSTTLDEIVHDFSLDKVGRIRIIGRASQEFLDRVVDQRLLSFLTWNGCCLFGG